MTLIGPGDRDFECYGLSAAIDCQPPCGPALRSDREKTGRWWTGLFLRLGNSYVLFGHRIGDPFIFLGCIGSEAGCVFLDLFSHRHQKDARGNQDSCDPATSADLLVQEDASGKGVGYER